MWCGTSSPQPSSLRPTTSGPTARQSPRLSSAAHPPAMTPPPARAPLLARRTTLTSSSRSRVRSPGQSAGQSLVVPLPCHVAQPQTHYCKVPAGQLLQGYGCCDASLPGPYASRPCLPRTASPRTAERSCRRGSQPGTFAPSRADYPFGQVSLRCQTSFQSRHAVWCAAGAAVAALPPAARVASL